MATILRSSRYIRSLNGFAQRIVVAHDKTNFTKKCLAIQARCINSYLTKSYATIPATQSKETTANFDSILSALDFKVQRYGRVFYNEVEDVLAKIRETGYIPSLDALLLIRCCGDLLVDMRPEDRNRLAQEIWNTLETLNIPVDISHFNALLRVYLENNYDFSPTEFLTKLRKKGIQPNKVTYQRLILRYCKNGDIEGATRILEFMKAKGLPLNESVFNALITGHSEANDMEAAKNILNLMRQVDVEPGVSTYCALLRAYAKRGDMESIRNTLKELESKDVSLQDRDFLDIIHVLAANGYTNEVDEIVAMLPFTQGYNVDAVHAILKVLDVGNIDVALKILATMRKRRSTVDEDESESSSGTFLLRKLVNSKYPPNKVIQTCVEMERQGLHTRAFNTAVERALDNGNVELSVELLKAWKENGGTVREHYFWPLIVAHGKACNYQGIYDVLQTMVKDFKIIPGYEMIRDYILPYTVGKWDETVATMKEFRVPHATAISAIANRLLLDKKIRKAAMFMTSYPVNYVAESFYRPLVEALNYTGDAKSFTVILRFLYDSAANLCEEHSDDKTMPLPEDVIDTALRMMLDVLTHRKAPYVEDVLTNLVEGGFTISSELGDTLREFFSENATPETYANIDKLTSGTLELTSLSEFNVYDASNGEPGSDLLSVDGNGKMFAAKRRQLAYCLKTGNFETVKTIVNDMDRLKFNFSPAVCSQIIEAACQAEDIEMADKWVNRLRQEHPDDQLDLQKATKYAALLISKNRFDDALQFILERPRKEGPQNLPMALKKMVKQLLDTAAETGDVEKTNQLFEALVESNYLSVDNYMLGPLVKVHLIRNDLEGALEAFQKACLTYQCTPLKNELSKKFIDAEDANSLQRLTDLSTQIHGESNSLADLVLAFLECGRSRQARKILETPGLRVRTKKLKACAQRYVSEDKIDCLEQFIELTKNLQIVDRHELYDVFLEAFTKNNDWQRGLSLWTEMQDEDLQPSEAFLTSLASLLIRNNQPVPFVYQKEKITEIAKPEALYVQNFRNAMQVGDLDKAEKIVMNADSNDTNLSAVMSELIDEFVERNDLDRACKLIDVLMLKYMRQPRASSLKGVWNALIEAKQFEKLRAHAQNLSSAVKKNLRFQKYLNRATLAEHGLEKCLEQLESKLTNSKVDNLSIITNTLHFSSYLREFKNNPNAVEKFKPIAEKLAEQDIFLPVNMMWCYYLENNHPEADTLWSKYLTRSHWIVFNYLIDTSNKDNNTDLLERLNEKIWTSEALTDMAKMTVLSSLIELYAENKKYDEAVNVLKRNQALDMERFAKNHPNAMQKLKEGLESNGTPFPFQLTDTRQPSASEANERKNADTVE